MEEGEEGVVGQPAVVNLSEVGPHRLQNCHHNVKTEIITLLGLPSILLFRDLHNVSTHLSEILRAVRRWLKQLRISPDWRTATLIMLPTNPAAPATSVTIPHSQEN